MFSFACGIAAVLSTVTAEAAVFILTKATIDSCNNNVVDFSKTTLGTGAGQVANTVQPGDTIQIESHTRTRVTLLSLKGTTTQKITVTNTPGGQFIIGDVTVNGTMTSGVGIGLWGAQHVIFKGTPTSTGAYGIKITHATAAHAIKVDYNQGYQSLYSRPAEGSFDVEITGVEISNTSFDGIQTKCERALADLPAGYVMDSIKIHDNYIHDTGGEGMYIGWATAGDHEDMSNVTIYNNKLERTGWDGIQLNRARTGTNAIYNNTISGFGVKSNSWTGGPYAWQASGMSIGSSKVNIYNNFIETVSGAGEQYQAAGLSVFIYDHSKIYNNVIALNQYGASMPADGIYLNQAAGETPPAGTQMDVMNNTILRPDRFGLAVGLNVTTPVKFYNNIVAAPADIGAPSPRASDYYYIEPNSGASLTLSNNLFTPTVAGAGFTNANANLLDLTPSSPAVNAGANVASYGITTDIEGVSRPQGSAYDIGAYELITSTVILTPSAWGTATGSLYCAALGAFDAQPTWDATNLRPVGDDPVPNSGTTTAYANRFWYVDFGVDWAKIRLTGMWTRYRPYSGGSYSGFAALWWDDDKDTVNDGTAAAGLNFATGQNLSHINAQQWVQDRNFDSAPVTPAGRYLVISTGPAPTDRANEFAFVGYVVP